ncbi:MAG: hypothetical protein ACR2GT_01300 [Gaiellaceae bacterium]
MLAALLRPIFIAESAEAARELVGGALERLRELRSRCRKSQQDVRKMSAALKSVCWRQPALADHVAARHA